MSYSGRQHIATPYYNLFWFIAAQRGASDEQIGEATGHKPRDVFATNRGTSQTLAYPLSGNKVGVTLSETKEWWATWQANHQDLLPVTSIGLHASRETIDSYLRFEHGRWAK